MPKIQKYLPRKILFLIRCILHFIGRYGKTIYSQEGEDVLLARFIGEKKKGFYVDVGAHHPSRFSNTFYFYKRGWQGINIDPWPKSMQLFRILRHRDINLEIAVSEKESVLDFHIFEEPLLNTGDPELAKSRNKNQSSQVVSVKALPLKKILEEHLPKGVLIDFMSIDVEGMDLSVLRSNDWSAFRPKYVIIEALGESVTSLLNTEIHKFLDSVDYEPNSKLFHSVIYRDRSLGKIEYI